VSTFKKGLFLALVQVLLVTGVGAKLMIDRARYPQAWVQTAPYDPNLPLRGRYVRLTAVLEPAAPLLDSNVYQEQGRLEVRDGRLFAIRDKTGPIYFAKGRCGQRECLTLSKPLAFFVPESVKDPSIRSGDEQLWVRVTVPPRGNPRPIRLGVRKQGRLTPLKL